MFIRLIKNLNLHRSLGGIITEWYRISGHVVEALDAEGVAIGEKSWSRIPILRKKLNDLVSLDL
jgi:hypothetical protein